MFYISENTLIIVYKDDFAINQIKKLSNANTIKFGSEYKNVLPNIQFWSEELWLENKKAKYISNKVLFLGEIKESLHFVKMVDVAFDKFGVKYGFSENRAIIWTNPDVLINTKVYQQFLNELNDLPVLDSLKAKQKSQITTQKIVVAATLDLFFTLGASSATLFAKDAIESKKTMTQQMIAYGIINFFNSDLKRFMEENVTRNIDLEKNVYNKKRKLRCPSCKNGIMMFNKGVGRWSCESCSYKISKETPLMFWFCDSCQSYLNSQKGFEFKSLKHICNNCGHENDITFDTSKSVCLDCGKILFDSHLNVCADCKQIRKEKRAIVAGNFVGGMVVAAGAAILALQSITQEGDDDEDEYIYTTFQDENDLRIKYNSDWMKNASLDELKLEREKVREDYANPNLDIDYRGDLWDLLHEFDANINEKHSKSDKNDYVGPAFHREHGWYLPNDD